MTLSRSRFPLVVLTLAAACGGGDPTGATDPGGTINPSGTTVTVAPNNVVIGVGRNRTLSGVITDAAGNPVTGTLTWQTSSAAIATIDATGKLTAVAVGVTNITASYGSVKSADVPVAVTDTAPWPTAGTATASSGALIATAVQTGALTEEQGLTYGVYAAFMDARLPTAYRGAPEDGVDSNILLRVSAKWSTLSAATKALLHPFFVSPGADNSWFSARFPGNNAGSAIQPVAGAFTPTTAKDEIDCLAKLAERGWNLTTTTHFMIHYSAQSIFGEQSIAKSAETAALVAAEIETIYGAEFGVFQKEPMPDLTQANNGCNGKVDVWIYDIFSDFSNTAEKAHVLGQAVPYVEGSCQTPSSIHMPASTNPAAEAKKIRATLAHEFFHVLELGSYTHAGCLDEYYWLGEATGNWAMDLVYKDDNIEQGWAANYAFKERKAPLEDSYSFADGDKTNGYCDYVFLLYLARKYDNTVIRAIWDATGGANSTVAVANALESHGGIKKVWAEFAVAEWNNTDDHNNDDFFKWDKLESGMKREFFLVDAGFFKEDSKPSTKVDMEGAPKKTFEMLLAAPASGPGRELRHLTIWADYLKFKDENVSAVLYVNALALADFPYLKIQALIKKGGAWQDVEDWTKEGFKSFCRDKKDERIEELVLIYSNSDATRGPAIPFYFAPSVSVSNVGCWKWQGTSSIETVVTGPAGGTSNVSATTFALERYRPPELKDGAPGQETFNSVTGGAISASSAASCATSSGNGTVAADDGELLIELDNMVIGVNFGPPPTRDILQGTGSTYLSTTTNLCNGTSATNQQSWGWFEIPLPGPVVSADGRKIEGNVVQGPLPGGPPVTTTYKWNLTAVREP